MSKKEKRSAFPMCDAYVTRLGFVPAESAQRLQMMLAQSCGTYKTQQMLNALDGEGSARLGEVNYRGFYSLMYSALDTALVYDGGMDGDYYVAMCQFLESHRQLLTGQTLLDAGCGDGVLTCFIAMLRPDMAVLGVDENRYAVRAAQNLAKRLNLGNVKFAVSKTDNDDLGQFDTVVSSRLMKENFLSQYGLVDESQLMFKACRSFADGFGPFAKSLRARMKEDGSLLIAEVKEDNPLLLAWLMALNRAGIHGTAYELMQYRRLGQETRLLALAGKVQETEDDWDVFNFFSLAIYATQFEQEKTGSQNFRTDLSTQLMIKDLVEGYRMYTQDGTPAGKYAVWTVTSDDSLVLLEQHIFAQNQTIATLGKKEDADVLIRQVRAAVRTSMGNDLYAKTLTYKAPDEREDRTLKTPEEVMADDAPFNL